LTHTALTCSQDTGGEDIDRGQRDTDRDLHRLHSPLRQQILRGLL
jgi:hypothetical protein